MHITRFFLTVILRELTSMGVNNKKTGTQSPEDRKFSFTSCRAYLPLTINDAFFCLLACIYDQCSAYWVYLMFLTLEGHGQGWDGSAEMERPSEQQGFWQCNLTCSSPSSPPHTRPPAWTCLENQLPHNYQKWFGAPQKSPISRAPSLFDLSAPWKSPINKTRLFALIHNSLYRKVLAPVCF